MHSLESELVLKKVAEITGKPRIGKKFKKERIDLVRMQIVIHDPLFFFSSSPCHSNKAMVGCVTLYVLQDALNLLSEHHLKAMGVSSLGDRYDSLSRCTSLR